MATVFRIEGQTGRFQLDAEPPSGTRPLAFDPLLRLYAAQDCRPSQIVSIDLSSLTPTERGCLAVDGTITCYLESQLLEPIDVIGCGQTSETLAADEPWLSACRGGRVIRRHVQLRGAVSGRVHALATSLIVEDRIRAVLGRDPGGIPEGIGRMLQNARVPQFRELLWFGRGPIMAFPREHAALSCGIALTRTYRIHAGRDPVMLITEWFGLDPALIP